LIELAADISLLSNRQKLILTLYNEKKFATEISKMMELNKTAVYREVNFLIDNGYTGQIPKTKTLTVNLPISENPDVFLEKMVSFDFTDEQKEFILSNKKLSRGQLAKKLKINKSYFNQALQKNFIIIRKDLAFD
jgi:predicted transcriptional regulator